MEGLVFPARTRAVRSLVSLVPGDDAARWARDLLGGLWDFLAARRSGLAFAGSDAPFPSGKPTLDDLGAALAWVAHEPRTRTNAVLARIDPSNGLPDASPASFAPLLAIAVLDPVDGRRTFVRAASALRGFMGGEQAPARGTTTAVLPPEGEDRDHAVAVLAWDMTPCRDGSPGGVSASRHARAHLECALHLRKGARPDLAAAVESASTAIGEPAAGLAMADAAAAVGGRCTEAAALVRAVAVGAGENARRMLAAEVARGRDRVAA